jgi:hypothetical protein
MTLIGGYSGARSMRHYVASMWFVLNVSYSVWLIQNQLHFGEYAWALGGGGLLRNLTAQRHSG